jgi:hypothetical protein
MPSQYDPDLRHPVPAGGTVPRHFYKTVASNATPEVLGENIVLMTSIIFEGIKALSTNNTGNVTIQTRKNIAGVWTFTDVLVLAPGDIVEWKMQDDESIRASDFYVKVATNNDGVRVQYHQR